MKNSAYLHKYNPTASTANTTVHQVRGGANPHQFSQQKHPHLKAALYRRGIKPIGGQA